jgi:hypothetical protein
MNRIQFQAGLTLPRFIDRYGTEEVSGNKENTARQSR